MPENKTFPINTNHLSKLLGRLIAPAGAALLFTACGFTPPPEFHEVAKMDPAQVPAVGMDDAGVSAATDAGQAEDTAKNEGMKGSLQLGVGFSTIPAMPISQLLGKNRDSVETLLAPVKPETREEKAALKEQENLGWIKYSENLRVRYNEEDIVIEFEQKVPSDLSCRDAAIWLGFGEAKEPVEKDGLCEWPKDDTTHSLAETVHGKLTKETSLFQAEKPYTPPTPEEAEAK